MKSKMRLTLFLTLAITIVIYYIIFPRHTLEAPDAAHSATSTPAAVTDSFAPISHTTKTDTYENGEVVINMTMPVITGLKTEAINNAVNAVIEKVYTDSKKSFLEDTKDYKIISSDQKNQLTLEGGAPVSSREKTFYVEINVFSYYSGAAHPLSQKIVLNFVKETGQLIRLEDVLKKDSAGALNGGVSTLDQSDNASNSGISGALNAVARLAKPKIIEQLAQGLKGGETQGNASDGTRGSTKDGVQIYNDAFQESGAAPTTENYQTFYLQKDSIDWVFGQYQVAAYVFGEIRISIPLRDLSAYLADREWLK